jgi:arginine-tRNA-protein transferase
MNEAEASFYPAISPPVAVELAHMPAHACPYLPERTATLRAFCARQIDPEIYQRFLDASFRRSGSVIYQPICRGCRACQPLRVSVKSFHPNKSQRRCKRQNADLTITAAPPAATDEKFDLYSRYQADRHSAAEPDTRATFENFLYRSPVQTAEFCYRDPENRLLAVGICDLSHVSVSSVYFYFDPAHSRRGLGTFGALHEIDFALNAEIPYYYLGYWVRGCRKMEYKADFRPCEALSPDGCWRPL